MVRLEPDRMLELRKAGMSAEEIAERADDFTTADVEREIRLVMKNKSVLTPDAATMLTLERFDSMNRALWIRAMSGDREAIKAVSDLQAKRQSIIDRAREHRVTPARQLQEQMRDLMDEWTDRS